MTPAEPLRVRAHSERLQRALIQLRAIDSQKLGGTAQRYLVAAIVTIDMVADELEKEGR